MPLCVCTHAQQVKICRHNTDNINNRRPCCAVALRRTAWSEHRMASVDQTRPHCVNQMGKTHSKPLAARHGRGMAWARHAMCESALRHFSIMQMRRVVERRHCSRPPLSACTSRRSALVQPSPESYCPELLDRR